MHMYVSLFAVETLLRKEARLRRLVSRRRLASRRRWVLLVRGLLVRGQVSVRIAGGYQVHSWQQNFLHFSSMHFSVSTMDMY